MTDRTTYEDDAVALDCDGETGIARITICQPDRRNALSTAVADGIVAALSELEGSDARCVAVAGEGPVFSAGGDVAAMVERAESDAPVAAGIRRVRRGTARPVRRLAECEFPTVALVDGVAVGAGAALAIAADLQLLSADARIGFGFRNVGLAVDSGVSHLLPGLVGDNVARELVYTGELVDAERAADIGLANHVYPVDAFEERAEELLASIADGPPAALRASKRLLRHGPTASLSAAIDAEAATQGALFESADHAEGVAAFQEDRDPEFEGP